MKKIVFATNNQHKLDEIRQILGEEFDILSLNDIGCHDDIPETGDTLEANALQKAQYVVDRYGVSCFADDTGLEVDSLGGAPGIYSARYASMEGSISPIRPKSHDSEANMSRLLRELGDSDQRQARFRTVIALMMLRSQGVEESRSQDKTLLFEGIVEGHIAHERRGSEGFGYDPIFVPDGYDQSFAELGPDVKNTISHRARAVAKLAEYLKRTCCLLLFCLATLSPCLAASIGSWKAYLAYSNITEIEKAGTTFFVLASTNLYAYNTADQSVQTYSKMDALSDCSIDHIGWNRKAQRLLIVYENENIDLLELNGNSTNMPEYYMKTVTGDKSVSDIYMYEQYAYLSTGFGILKVNVAKAEISDTYTLGFAVDYAYIDSGKIYAASSSQGLYAANLTDNLLDKSNWSRVGGYTKKDKTLNAEWLEEVVKGNPGGPKHNYFGFLKFANQRLYSCNGLIGRSTNGEIQVLHDDEWQVYSSDGIRQSTGMLFDNMTCLDVDPADPNHVFGGARNGVYEFSDGQFSAYYNCDNSPIEPFDRTSKEYELVTGMKYDTQGNLWCLNSQAPTQALIERTRDGQWVSHPQSQLMKLDDGGITGKSLGSLERMMTDSRGLLWFVNNHWITPSLYCYNTETDKLTAFTSFSNQDGTTVSVVQVRCVAEDLDGNIWIGTNVGPLLLPPSEFQSSNPVFTQVKVPRNDGSNYADYLFSGLDVTSIAIDGGGRKWFGSYNNGVYLISADNMTQLHHFTAENSDLLSDNIEDIAIDNQTGEVFFGTDKGLCSYMSDATATVDEMTKDNVYAYPNPVRPGYTGLITVTGLTYDADVKIVTANGALVAEGRSNGGTFTWNGLDLGGKRVASGVYMVQTATSTGEKGTVCKIAIIN